MLSSNIPCGGMLDGRKGKNEMVPVSIRVRVGLNSMYHERSGLKRMSEQ